mmetsp:Transcript_68993/g.183833  ORF Transcript_68993/g.183833 Transcript_68993/m.183833 type:complete len:204 (-) Transcript_68993:1877-2488(-)
MCQARRPPRTPADRGTPSRPTGVDLGRCDLARVTRRPPAPLRCAVPPGWPRAAAAVLPAPPSPLHAGTPPQSLPLAGSRLPTIATTGSAPPLGDQAGYRTQHRRWTDGENPLPIPEVRSLAQADPCPSPWRPRRRFPPGLPPPTAARAPPWCSSSCYCRPAGASSSCGPPPPSPAPRWPRATHGAQQWAQPRGPPPPRIAGQK